MARVKRGVTAGRRHKKVLGKAKGYYNARRKVYRAAKRFRKTAKGFKGYAANRRHNLGHKTRKIKRHARSGGSSLVDKTDVGRLEQLDRKSTRLNSSH